LAACWFRNKFLFAGVTALGVLLVMQPMFLPAGIRYRMEMTLVRSPADFGHAEDIAENFETSSARRIEIWRGAAAMIKDYPWWGVGYGAFPRMIPHYTQTNLGYVDAHNSYLLIAAEMGIPTLAVFLLVLLMAWWYTYWLYWHTKDQSIKAIALGFLSGLVGLLVAVMFGSRMDDQAVSSYFWVLCGLIMRSVIIERQERRQCSASS
jgi:O-antigen ligase